MKKKISRLFSLMVAVMLLASLALNASALSGNMDGLPGFSADAAKDSFSDFSAADNPGIFALKLTKGTKSYAVAAYLMQNGEYTYLLTHEIASEYEDDGYELTIMAPNGSNAPTFCTAVDDKYDIAYLYAEGLEVFTPLQASKGTFSGTINVGMPYCNEDLTQCRRIEHKAFDFSKWNQVRTGLYTQASLEVPDNWLGAPVFMSNTDYTMYGMATWYESGDTYVRAVINFTDLTLYADYSLELLPYLDSDDPTKATDSTTEPTETTPDDTDPVLNPRLILVAVALIAGIGYFVYSRKQKEKEELRRRQQEAAAAAAAAEMTIPVGATAPVHTHGVTKAVSNWQLRSTTGPLSGKSFPLSGSMKIGRSSSSDIAFPDNTAGVSGNHCEIRLSGNTVTLRDVGSTYGTFVNGNRIAPNTDVTLYPSDSFALSQSGPAFRLENLGGIGGTVQAGPAVKDMQGKVYQSKSSGKLTFGRNGDNTVVMQTPNKEISGSHCVLYREGGNLYLKDLGSTNGTFFTEKDRLKPNTPYRIRRGQAFFLCSAKYTFVVTEE